MFASSASRATSALIGLQLAEHLAEAQGAALSIDEVDALRSRIVLTFHAAELK